MPSIAPRPRRRTLRALAGFGLTTDAPDHARARLADAAHRAAPGLAARLAPGAVALVVGPSGCGKSTLLRAVADHLRAAGAPVLDAAAELARALRSGRPVAELFPGRPLEGDRGVLRTLSAAGLADALPLARPAGRLSEGQRARLAVALAMHGATRPGRPAPATPALLLDELGATLDDATARALCASLRRWAGLERGVRVLAATPRSGVPAWLGPALVVDAAPLAGGGEPLVSTPAPSPPAPGPVIAVGSAADYAALAPQHYRAGRPGAVVRTLVARDPGAPAGSPPVGVLTVSMPVLNGPWRDGAWPGEYRGDRRAAAAHLNATLRCISRVIVAGPRRGEGIGAALVRAYLADPLTPRTEALAAMGTASPLFTRAGMTERPVGRARRDERLIDALGAAGLRPWMLAHVPDALEAVGTHAWLDAALRTWADASRATRALSHGPVEGLVRAAARRVAARPRAYTHGA